MSEFICIIILTTLAVLCCMVLSLLILMIKDFVSFLYGCTIEVTKEVLCPVGEWISGVVETVINKVIE